MTDEQSILTDRGQVRIPASIRRDMGLQPGQALIWRKISNDELCVRIGGRKTLRSAASVIGRVKKLHEERGWATRTDEWLKVLRS